MKAITHAEVRRIAHLARLHLDEGQVAEVSAELARILEAFSALQAAELEPAKPSWDTPPAVDRRADVVGVSLTRERALAGAPDAEDGHIRIPRVLG
jgi:aspartyl-tRNA(Asn)/glutamyl-tRNA(Gln) amidotransferase subunit C